MGISFSNEETLKEILREVKSQRANVIANVQTNNLPSQSNESNSNGESKSQLAVQRYLRKVLSDIENKSFLFGCNEYKALNLKSGELLPTLHESFTSMFPDQIPKDLFKEFLMTRGPVFSQEETKKEYLQLKGEKKPQRIKNTDFVTILTQTFLSTAVHSLSALENEAKFFIDLFCLDPIDYLLDEYFVMDTTPVRALKIQQKDNVWIAPAVVLFKRSSIRAY
jgi:hypothetical protein